MKTLAFAIATTFAIAVSAGSATAGSWKHGGYNSQTKSSLINVSPSVDVGGLLNGSAIASGNVLQGILSDNNTSLTNSVLGGVTNLLGNKKKRR